MLPLKGKEKNPFFINMDMQDHAIYHAWLLFSYLLKPKEREERPFLELNPGPLASQATALTTRPCLLRLAEKNTCYATTRTNKTLDDVHHVIILRLEANSSAE